jgi:hypothetical protein
MYPDLNKAIGLIDTAAVLQSVRNTGLDLC